VHQATAHRPAGHAVGADAAAGDTDMFRRRRSLNAVYGRRVSRRFCFRGGRGRMGARPVARACEATVAVWALEGALSTIPTVDRAVLAARIFVIRQLINGFTLR